ncbi:hypothetical protein CQA49_06665 [Helicobacter sp. MIT 00-7814]|uniref:hypothetical protein n=1 Tax=unclassified Helicobacter TaxID=2593540 RepID=UPI000E1EEAC7|nr:MULTISPECIES: hypothetical protein [unclassified Helicobacter]RDU53325.1 hypothetical protein CQA49_06665 [Helicobacter sp. MIT 00-7814]RDU54146.1 hypothetical protein CQA37_05905 [Helicobacter sp. MIT 99-10781]
MKKAIFKSRNDLGAVFGVVFAVITTIILSMVAEKIGVLDSLLSLAKQHLNTEKPQESAIVLSFYLIPFMLLFSVGAYIGFYASKYKPFLDYITHTDTKYAINSAESAKVGLRAFGTLVSAFLMFSTILYISKSFLPELLETQIVNLETVAIFCVLLATTIVSIILGYFSIFSNIDNRATRPN